MIVPAYNEAETITETVRSLLEQTVVPGARRRRRRLLDRRHGRQVARGRWARRSSRPPRTRARRPARRCTRSSDVETELVMAVDADTTLAPDAIELLLPALDDPEVVAGLRLRPAPRRRARSGSGAATSSTCSPSASSSGSRTRSSKPLISSGCFSVYRTGELREAGGWSTRTMAEDMDLTWTLYAEATRCGSCPRRSPTRSSRTTSASWASSCRRWSHGFVQNVRLHWRSLLSLGYLRSTVAVAFWDAVRRLARLPRDPAAARHPGQPAHPRRLPDRRSRRPRSGPLAGGRPPRGASRRWRASRASSSCGWSTASSCCSAIWRELVVRRPLLVYEKGH